MHSAIDINSETLPGEDIQNLIRFKTQNLFTLLEEKVLYRTLKGSISATYLEPLKGSTLSEKRVQKLSLGLYLFKMVP